MIRVRARYRNHRFELNQALELNDGAEVEIVVLPVSADSGAAEEDGWRHVGLARLAEEYNDKDSVYDNWKGLYGS